MTLMEFLKKIFKDLGIEGPTYIDFFHINSAKISAKHDMRFYWARTIRGTDDRIAQQVCRVRDKHGVTHALVRNGKCEGGEPYFSSASSRFFYDLNMHDRVIFDGKTMVAY